MAFFPKFCDIGALVIIIHKRTQPNLLTSQRGKQKRIRIHFLHFENMWGSLLSKNANLRRIFFSHVHIWSIGPMFCIKNPLHNLHVHCYFCLLPGCKNSTRMQNVFMFVQFSGNPRISAKVSGYLYLGENTVYLCICGLIN